MATPKPSGYTGSTSTDAQYTSDSEILYRIGQMRENRRLAPSSAWDKVWLDRIKRGEATLGDARSALEQRAIRESDPNFSRPEVESDPDPTGWSGDTPTDAGVTDPDDVRDRVAAMRRNRGLAPSPAWDNVWAERIMAGEADLGDARTALEQRAVRESGDPSPEQREKPGAPGPGEQDEIGDPDPTYNYREFAPPWMKGELLDEFVDSWSDTGDAGLALEAVRRSKAYDRYFPGNRREDGSLRYSEQEYFSQRDGFREAAREFGVGDLSQSQVTALFENDVDAREFFQGVGQAYERFTEPGADTDGQLMSAYVEAFTDTGSDVAALQAVRGSDAYGQAFAGNRREDGSLRMEEQEYFAYKRGWQRTLLANGLDPQLFEGKGRFVQSVEGEVSIQEIEGRLKATQEGIVGNIAEVKQFYAENYGLRMTDEAILGAAIDPEIGTDLLQRRITAGQVGGEARLQGFARSVERAEELARAGLGQGQARNLYSEAASRVPTLDTLARRHNDPRGEFGVGGFEDAAFLGDADTRGRMERRLQDEQSSFSTRLGVRRDERSGGLSGLRQR